MSIFNSAIINLMPVTPKFLIKRVASRYIAGETLQETIASVQQLNNKGALTTIDLLGEQGKGKEHAEEAAKTYVKILDAIEENKLNSNVSLKPTHMGLNFGVDLCYELIEGIVKHAKKLNNFVRIDMEDSPYTDDTLKMFFDLRKKYDNVGVVVQAYMRRTMADTRDLIKHKSNVRVCKGIYREDYKIAYHDRKIIINNYASIIRELLSNGCYVGIATHCEETVWEAFKVIHELKLKPEQYEFQMLLGVAEELRQIILDGGHRLRVYVPFGTEWYPYSSRRLKENPKIAGYVIKDFLRFDRKR